MLSKPWSGWTTITIDNKIIGDASYLDWIPGLIIEPCLRYLSLCKESIETYGSTTGGYGLNIEFDAEGHNFGLVEIGDTLYTYNTLGEVDPHINLTEVYTLENYDFVYNLVKEVINDIEANYEEWVTWDVMTDDKEEYQHSKDSLDQLLDKAKHALEDFDKALSKLCKRPELGHLLWGNPFEAFPLPRDEWQNAFCNFLEETGFDSYGHIEDDRLEAYLETKTSKYTNEDIYGSDCKNEDIRNNLSYHPHLHYFDNGTFMLCPYYWGDADDLKSMHNFIYYSEDIKITWYKYPLRDAYVNKEITFEQFCGALQKCKESLNKVKE